MAKGDGIDLSGTGAAYIRVSTDQQDTERQYAGIGAFEQRQGVKVARQFWFEDEGWARDQADQRPDFQRLMRLAEGGRVQWIVVDKLDRFGTKDPYQLIHYLYRLRECGCRLYDSAGKEWTGEDIATIITAVVEGEKSKGEQIEKSYRVMGGKVEKARAGEWQGGPVRLGFDVACYHRESGKELWRVIIEGRNKRLKAYPDGRSERFDGRDNFPKFQQVTEVLRIAPSKDRAKVAAAVSVFRRYATESIGFSVLAHYLDGLGYRNGCGGVFQHQQIEEMLKDPIYIGYYTWNKWHFGKFHRYTDGQAVPELNYGEKGSRNDPAHWVQSRRLFDPLVDQKTWDAVQRKLAKRQKRTNAPRSAKQYLAGLLYCGNCGSRMLTGHSRPPTSKPRKDGSTGERVEFFCGSYYRAVRDRRRHECKCLRNSIFQDTLDGYVKQWLEESGRRLDLMTRGPGPSDLTGRLEQQEGEHWQAFRDGLDRLCRYLARHHPEEYAAILGEQDARQAEDDEWLQGSQAGSRAAERLGGRFRAAHERAKKGGRAAVESDDIVGPLVDCYRSRFDPAAVDAELAKLRAEHDRLVEGWGDLPTKRAKDTAAARLADLDTRMGELERQRENVAEVVASHYREMHDLQQSIASAKLAMRSETGEEALRQRAEALRSLIQRIECRFVATGQTGSGWGKRNARLVEVTIYPVVGEEASYSVDSKGTLIYSSAHSFMNLTRSGRTR